MSKALRILKGILMPFRIAGHAGRTHNAAVYIDTEVL
jgi:hypothetical protein